MPGGRLSSQRYYGHAKRPIDYKMVDRPIYVGRCGCQPPVRTRPSSPRRAVLTYLTLCSVCVITLYLLLATSQTHLGRLEEMLKAGTDRRSVQRREQVNRLQHDVADLSLQVDHLDHLVKDDQVELQRVMDLANKTGILEVLGHDAGHRARKDKQH